MTLAELEFATVVLKSIFALREKLKAKIAYGVIV
jgi:hypothetical protein